MGVVKYATGIDYVSGALSKPVKKNGHNHGTYLIGTHRVKPTSNPNCTRLYVGNSDRYNRTTPVTTTEYNRRIRFATIAAAVAARKKDLSKVSTDQAAFLEQRDTAGGIKTMLKYLWSLEMQKYDQEHPQS